MWKLKLKKRSIQNLLILLITLVSIASYQNHVQAEEVSLQQLIEETPANGVLELEAKTYEGNINIYKPITIIGKEGTQIKGDGTKTVVEIESDNVTLDTIHISDSGFDQSSFEEYSGIRVMGDNAVLKNLTITDVFHGIYLSRANETTIENVHIVGQKTQSLTEQGNGIHIIRAFDNVIKNSSIEKVRDGIYVEYGHGNIIENNKITETRYGLHYMYSNNNQFHHNEFTGNIGGAAIMQSDTILLEDNSFSFNQGTRAFGLLIQTSRHVHVLNNKFYQNQRGLFIEQSTNNTIEGNEFFHNQIGVELWTTSTSQVFFDNIFLKNNTSAVTVGSESFNEWFTNGKGNYWDTPMLDLDQDGFGDEPFEYHSTIGELLQDNELAYLFLSSAAIGLYEKTKSLLGDQEVMAYDEYPRMARSDTDYTPIWIAVMVMTIMITLFYVRKRRQT